MDRWWRTRSRGQRFVVAVIGAILAINIGFAAVGSVFDRGPSGPASSPGATAEDGLAGFVDLLRTIGHEVTVTTGELEPDALDPAATVFLADPIDLGLAELDHLTGFLRSGGRLVLAGPATVEPLAAVTGTEVGFDSVFDGTESVDRIDVADRTELAGGARTITDSSGHRWRDTADLEILAGPSERPFAVTGPVGSGRVVGLADIDPLRNRHLARADNAAFGVGLAGERPVVLIDRTTSPESTGFAAIPPGWKWAALALSFTAVLLLWATAARFGPPEPAERSLHPARMGHVDAVAAGIARHRPTPAAATDRMRARERAALAAHVGTEPDASDAVLAATARTHGIADEDLETVLDEPVTTVGALRLGRLAAQRAARRWERTGPEPTTTRPPDEPGDHE